MKKIGLILSFCFVAFICNAQSASTDISKVLAITNDNYDFGTITKGKPVEYNISIKNISADTVIIENIMVGCGCTSPKYTKGQKIAPGSLASIGLGFNGSAQGNFEKYATLFFAGGLTKQVKFHGVAQ